MADTQPLIDEFDELNHTVDVASLPLPSETIDLFFTKLKEEPLNARLEALQLGKDVCAMFPEPLPNHIFYTASHLFNQFYTTNNINDYPVEEIMLTCLHISLKVWEIEIEIETLVIFGLRYIKNQFQLNFSKLQNLENFWEKLIQWDIEILNLVNVEFSVNTGDLDLGEKVQQSLGYFELSTTQDEDFVIEFYERVTTSLNDIYLTPMPGIYPGNYLAASAFYLTTLRNPAPVSDNWLKYFNLNPMDLYHVYQIIYHTLTRLQALQPPNGHGEEGMNEYPSAESINLDSHRTANAH